MKSRAAEKRTFNVAVVGATGAVGLEMVRMLEERSFPVNQIKLFASERSQGKPLRFRNEEVLVEALKPAVIRDLDLAIFSAGSTISRKFAPLFAEKGVFVIDNSSAWRMDKGIPLVVPEVNPRDLNREAKIIANPNCSTIQMVVVLKPIHDAARIKSVRVATYQSVSGAGATGMKELDNQLKAWAQGKPLPPPTKIPYQIAFNVIPQIDIFEDNGYTKEEIKMVNETKKILGDDSIAVSATCVRVPVFRCHSEAVWIETEKKLTAQQARSLLSKAPGVCLQDRPQDGIYPMPNTASGKAETYVGRIREDLITPHGLAMWIVSDNLLKGAALNAVQIAEELVNRRII